MSKPIERTFNFTSDGEIHDATVDETSEALESCQNYTWSITPILVGITGGTPEYTIEVSNDGVTWFEYNNASTNVSVEDAVDDTHLAFTKIRIVHDAKGASSGTVEYKFVQKQN